MTLPRLIATDLDGTLLRGDLTISTLTHDTLRRIVEAGVELVFVTARPPRYLDSLSALADLTSLAICSNGALVYDVHDRTVVTTHALTPAAARTVADALSAALPGASFAVETGLQVYGEPGYTDRCPQDTADQHTVVDSLDALLERADPILKLLVRADGTADEVLAAAGAAAAGLAEFTHSGSTGLLEVSATGVTKASTLAALCATRGIAAAEVLAFGDAPNDLGFLRWAGTGYAVANAHPSVLAAVPRRTDSNDANGVARVLADILRRDAYGPPS